MQTKRYHLLIGVENCPEISRDLLTVLLSELPGLIDMNILSGPFLADGIPENPGLSGFVLIDWSHISIHTFTTYNEALIDIFSCKEYDKESVIKFLAEKLQKNPADFHLTIASWG